MSMVLNREIEIPTLCYTALSKDGLDLRRFFLETIGVQ